MSTREDIHIDRYNLDNEIERQTELYYEAAEPIVQLNKDKSLLELQIKELEAKLAKKIRENIRNYFDEDERVSDKKISDLITLDPKLKKKRRKLLKINTELSRAKLNQESFAMRRSMLKYLVELFGDEYWTFDGKYLEREEEKEFADEMKEERKRLSKTKKKRRKRI